MKLEFQHRPYAGRQPRPTPELHFEAALNTLVIAVPWGPRYGARKAIDRVLEFLAFATQDREATSPLPKLSCLSETANNLRIAALLANDMLYREDNQDEYRVGVELLAFTLSGSELAWAQVGGPSLLLSRDDSAMLALESKTDLSLDCSQNKKQPLTALPSQLLGVDSTVNVSVNSYRARPKDRIVLLSHSQPPPAIHSWVRADTLLEEMTRQIAIATPEQAFWLGCIEIMAEKSDQLPLDEAA